MPNAKNALESSGPPLVGKRLDQSALPSSGANILAIERGTGFAANMLRPTAGTELKADDVLLADVHSSSDDIDKLWHSLKLEPLPLRETGNYLVDLSQEIGAAEVILRPSPGYRPNRA